MVEVGSMEGPLVRGEQSCWTWAGQIEGVGGLRLFSGVAESPGRAFGRGVIQWVRDASGSGGNDVKGRSWKQS